uniref:Glycosyltransferase family 92 protein n=1 Tax=Grammatophora oceanica TaxID=210454 RepID=A0A7S1Y9V9_9STRA|mmetsp:Transcript_35429/g.52716  ORF Transcript_35429/g.52716 Transcript_35429/m.52716 type:complete len:347 (+) Transcript_35429:178-1218(+)|eukprot:CAMPEP_0194027704 /NCGR_PEP_ID=MMETSP0009_2-20130614/1802_1 /TAXON_ID=210454 /ORGANISM="Grammatophora oceanica, Strain CCMP 410" /LENGTH=346 /DNA_ID=CAMNT_0038666855 /DNA_START=160 /DNA_END=1200 /DNA_ORIENTATION=-
MQVKAFLIGFSVGTFGLGFFYWAQSRLDGASSDCEESSSLIGAVDGNLDPLPSARQIALQNVPADPFAVYDPELPPLRVGVCAIIRDAEAYIDEWVDYNFAIGFHAMYIYDNSPNNDLKSWGQKVREEGKNVVVVPHGMAPANDTQDLAYNGCVERFGNESDYIAFVDDDEYLLLKKHADVSAFLREHLAQEGGCLTVNWARFGTSNHSLYAPIPVTRRYMLREWKTHYRVKCIITVKDFDKMRSPHAVWMKPGVPYRDTSGGGTYDHEDDWNMDRTDDVAVLNHYKWKSEKEWWYKECVRKTVLGDEKSCGEDSREGTIFDDAAWKVLRSRVPKYRAYDEWADHA